MKQPQYSIVFLLLLSSFLPVQLAGQDNNRHYVRTRLMTDETGTNYREAVTFYNSFGLNTEVREVGASPQGQDLQTRFGYDAAFRQVSETLPSPVGVTNFYNDSNPYHRTIYEHSSLDRVREEYGPGQAWLSNEKSVKYAYLTNSSSGDLYCAHFRAEDSGEDIKLIRAADYQPGELSVLKATDEDGNITYSFTDYAGRPILTRQMNGNVPHNTYIVYDDRGRKRIVLPPLAADNLTTPSGEWLCSQCEPVKLYGYTYKYNGRDLCVEKKLPGAEPISYVYDRADKVMLMQDGNDRAALRWQSFQYDVLGRLVIWGYITVNRTRTDWERICKNAETYIEFAGTFVHNNHGYTGITRVSNLCTPLIINFYDNYDYTSLYNDFIGSLTRSGYYSPSTSSKSKSKLTGQIVALLNDPTKKDFIAHYYDNRGREVQRTMKSAFGFRDYTFTQYDFIGQQLSVRKEHTSIHRANPPTSFNDVDHVIIYEYEYDHAGRMTRLYHTYDNTPRILMTKYEYDEVGRLERKRLHNETRVSTYKYNIRGWATEINEPGMIEKIYYNEDLPQGVQPLYNGNIPCLTNSVNGDLVSRFTYDGLNRLLTTRQYRANGSPTETSEAFTYDKMGNLLSSTRAQNDPQPHYTTRMSLSYNGNQIKKVTDISSGAGSYNYLNYPDFSNAATEYFYDANGSLIANLDNKVRLIKYNILNLPEVVAFTDGNILTYSYMADGRKVRDSYGSYPLSSSTPIDDVINNSDPYIAGHNDWNEEFYYAAGTLKRVTTPEGYLSYYSTTGFSTLYASKDHVGSVWQHWIGGVGLTTRYQSYYPSGILYTKPNIDYPFALGGKEFIAKNGLDEYYFGGRTMYAIMNRFNQKDPMCEKYYPVSPYAYCMNNPLRYTDPTGMWIMHRDTTGTYKYDNGKWYKYQATGENIGKYLAYTPTAGSFLAGVLEGLNELSKNSTGKGIMNFFANDENDVFVFSGDVNKADITNTAAGRIYLSADFKGSEIPTQDGIQTSPFWLDIGHELAHRQDVVLNGASQAAAPWLTTPEGDIISRSEKYATHMENKMRASAGLPLRTHYATYGDGGWEPSRILAPDSRKSTVINVPVIINGRTYPGVIPIGY